MTTIPGQSDAADKREVSRKRALKNGRAIINGGTSTFDCQIRDISRSGARLKFLGPVAVPDDFRLLIVESQAVYPVTKAWQRGLEVGVEFVSPPQPMSKR